MVRGAPEDQCWEDTVMEEKWSGTPEVLGLG